MCRAVGVLDSFEGFFRSCILSRFGFGRRGWKAGRMVLFGEPLVGYRVCGFEGGRRRGVYWGIGGVVLETGESSVYFVAGRRGN